MKIIIDISPLTSLPITGVGKILENLIEEFKKRKEIEITYFALVARGHLPELRKQYPNLKAPSIPARLSRKALYLAQAINFPQDLITGPADATISMSWLCFPMRCGKTVAIIADMTPFTDPQWHARTTVETFKRRLKSVERNADIVIAISDATKQEIIKTTKIPEKNIFVEYPGISQAFAKKVEKKEMYTVRKKYNLPNSLFLFVSTQEPRKNLKRLIQAYKKLNKEVRKNTKIVIAGRRGWGKQIKYPPFVQEVDHVPHKELPAIYATARGLLYPSLKEGFGLPIIEAFSLEVPVLTSNISSMVEIAKGAAILVDPYSVEDITRGLTELLTMNEQQRKRLIRAGKKRLKKFSYKKMADTIIDEIKKSK